ncbi:Sodium/hydrogen exchanger [Aspergillus heteromorphus CBS 117.55]|uniref:Sodium/hydrogen exchanger n=1 Tax=Aspergillus heteromorphus CBS 117.55 TaxID=1448321 RepID=A0A317V2T0_9EURO|nr:Sodium/hydrogen exchanger [Aspergillus heteromorphus CBS 117.55]PWY67949.1 Sodium/hydrogen exchanger [Aspergillus heteromorphus CBS 117.55]
MAGNDASSAALPYQEPSIATLLNLSGFLLALNLARVALDRLLSCGLIGQVLLGVLWGTPGARWLDRNTESVIQQLGYLGLILLVYEGGLSTAVRSIRANGLLSLAVALTGIGTPMGLSFVLKALTAASSRQAFAAGAALSATSLGTTFTILSTTGLVATRLGSVTTTAAVLDDVIGLVMVQIITNLGGEGSRIRVGTVLRPIGVSVAFVLGLFLLAAGCLRPVLARVLAIKDKVPSSLKTQQWAFLAQTLCLVGIVAGASYAGASSLFAAYLAGLLVSWVDGCVAEDQQSQHGARTVSEAEPEEPGPSDRGRRTPENPSSIGDEETPTGERVYEQYYREPVNRILLPLFFASIGFSIPVTEMFQWEVVWRGIVYALLMALGKMITGLWLVRLSLGPGLKVVGTLTRPFALVRLRCMSKATDCGKQEEPPKSSESQHAAPDAATGSSASTTGITETTTNGEASRRTLGREEPKNESPQPSTATPTLSLPPKPQTLYPPCILGLAMVARGEVGYLIASLAQSQGLFARDESGDTSHVYLIIIWAISLCTLVGPVAVGTLVRRVRTLQQARADSGVDPLGAWGI